MALNFLVEQVIIIKVFFLNCLGVLRTKALLDELPLLYIPYTKMSFATNRRLQKVQTHGFIDAHTDKKFNLPSAKISIYQNEILL